LPAQDKSYPDSQGRWTSTVVIAAMINRDEVLTDRLAAIIHLYKIFHVEIIYFSLLTAPKPSVRQRKNISLEKKL
jgi:hypothetical protein